MRIYDFQTVLERGLFKDQDMAVSIGVFDGAHLGHQKIFSTLADWTAAHPGTRSCVITFGTNPKTREVETLDTLRLRTLYMERFGIDLTWVIDFSNDFSKMSGSEFIRLLCTMCRIKAVIVGEDFKCGTLEDQVAAKELSGVFRSSGMDVEVKIIPPVEDSGHMRISSTRLRALLAAGDMAAVEALAGSPYRYDLCQNSFVQEGDGLAGRAVTRQRLPRDGAYKAKLILMDGRAFDCRLRVSGKDLVVIGCGLAAPVHADSILITP